MWAMIFIAVTAGNTIDINTKFESAEQCRAEAQKLIDFVERSRGHVVKAECKQEALRLKPALRFPTPLP